MRTVCDPFSTHFTFTRFRQGLTFCLLACWLLVTTNIHAQSYNAIAREVEPTSPTLIVDGKEISTRKAIAHFRQRPPDKFLDSIFKRYVGKSRAAQADDVLRGVYAYKQFEAVTLPHNLKWNENPLGSNSWEWNHHNLTAVDYLTSAWLASDEPKYFMRAQELVMGWARHNIGVKEFPSDYSWNDHTTARRLWRLLYLFEYGRKSELASDDFLTDLLFLIVHHAYVLADERFYNRLTNHGFDQAVVLYLATKMLPEVENFEALSNLAAERINAEIEFMFTPEGVHVENSPDYHWYLANSTAELTAIFDHYGATGELMYLSGILDRAFRYAAFTVKPDGTLPLVGDTILIQPGLSQQYHLPAFDYFRYAVTGGQEGRMPPTVDAVFPIAGYAIFRDQWHPAESFRDGIFILFKCGFLSNFHRQDDDLNFVLTALGEDWFVDSGRYSYQEAHPLRLYMRSPNAHNVPVPDDSIPVRSVAKLRPGTGVTAYGLSESRSYVEGRTTIHPTVDLTRRLEYDKHLTLRITDTLTPLNSGPPPRWSTFFQIPGDKRIEVIEPGEIMIHSPNRNALRLTYPAEDIARIESSCDTPIQGCRSKHMGQAEPIQTLILEHPVATTGSVVDLELIPVTAETVLLDKEAISCHGTPEISNTDQKCPVHQ